MKSKPTIETAKAIAKRHGMDGVIVFFYKDEKIGFASYGKDRAECRQCGKFADQIFEKIMAGEIEL